MMTDRRTILTLELHDDGAVSVSPEGAWNDDEVLASLYDRKGVRVIYGAAGQQALNNAYRVHMHPGSPAFEPTASIGERVGAARRSLVGVALLLLRYALIDDDMGLVPSLRKIAASRARGTN